ncbi:MAG: stress response translation initiation inhibitor YciH [Nitrososphaerales archaeon]
MSKNSGIDDLGAPGGDLKDVLQELDREESRIVVRLEMRKFRKPTTVVEGLSKDENTLRRVAHKLKHALATGGTGKDGFVLLQGDQRERTKEELVKMGYSDSRIEVQ